MQNPGPIRVVIADDHTVVREGLIAIISRCPGMSVVAEARDWLKALNKIDAYHPHVALLDVRMPGMSAVDGVTSIRRKHPEVKIVLISAFDFDEDIYGVFRAGANGFLVKDCARTEITTCVHAVLAGKVWLPAGPAAKLVARIQSPGLTSRQAEILELVADGKSNKEVGAAMRITEGTVKVHLSHIFRKLGAEGRTQAVRMALERGLVRLCKTA